MFDWDRNGKTDWRDAYVFNKIINKDSGKPSGHPSSPRIFQGDRMRLYRRVSLSVPDQQMTKQRSSRCFFLSYLEVVILSVRLP